MTTPFPSADDRSFEALNAGDVFEVTRTFSRDDVLAFAALSGDYSPLHVDSEYAATTEFGGCVVHGLLLASLFSQLVGMRVPGRPALYLGQDITFRRPVRVGETVRAMAKVQSKSDGMRTLQLATEIRTADGKVAVSGSAKVKVRGDETSVDRPVPLAHVQARRRVALVTGASRGLGAEIARHLGRRGMTVAVNYIKSAQQAAEVVNDIRAEGGEALAVQADVRDAADVERLLATCAAAAGEPDILVHAAIGELSPRDATDLRWEDFLGQFEYQVKAVLGLCQAVYPAMKRRGGGSIVNIASQVVTGTPPPRMADYVTAKHALEGLSKALASEWATDAIRVNVVSPALTRTDLTQFHQERVFRAEALRTPLHRLATPDDVARAVAYLAGDDAAFLTGTNLFVTGGQVML